MFDADSRDTSQRSRSLLSFDAAGGKPRTAGSLLAAAREQDDAVERHRLARVRRGVRSGLDEWPESTRATPPADDFDETGEIGRAGLARLLAGWRGRMRPAGQAENVESARSRHRDENSVTAAADISAPAPQAHFATAAGSGGDDRWKPLIDPMSVIGGVAKSKLLIAGTTLAGAIIAAAIALNTPKKYEAITELLIDPRDIKIVERDLTGSGLPSDATLALVENQVRVLTSGSVLNKVVEQLNLVSDPEFNGEQGGGIVSFITSLRSLLSRQDAGGGSGDQRRFALAVGNLAESLQVERGGKTFVVTVSVKTEDPEKSALIANTMADVFLQTYGQMQSETVTRATKELTSRLDELRKSVEAAERKVETFKAENDIIDAQGRLISDDEILKLNDQLATARAKTLELNAKAASIRSLDVNAVVSGALPEDANSNVLTELRSQYANLKQQADRLSVKLGPRHPESQAMAAQLGGAREQISVELRRVVSSLQVELKRAVQLEQELASRLAQLKVRQGNLSNELVTLRELERDATAKRAVYEAFLLRARETGEQKDLNTANMSVISTAYPPIDPLGPSRAMMTLAGMLLGFVAGIGIGGVRGAFESLRNSGNPHRPRPTPEDGGGGGRGRAAKAVDPGLAAGVPRREGAAWRKRERPIPHSFKNEGENLPTAPEATPAGRDPETAAPIGENPPMMGNWRDPRDFGSRAQEGLSETHPVSAQSQSQWPSFPPQPVHPNAPQFGPGYGRLPLSPPWQQPWAQHQPWAPPAPYSQPLPFQPSEAPPYAAQFHPLPQPVPRYQPHAVHPGHASPALYDSPAVVSSMPPAALHHAEGVRHQAAHWPEPSPLDEVRASLREFRHAVDELAERRARRRYS